VENRKGGGRGGDDHDDDDDDDDEMHEQLYKSLAGASRQRRESEGACGGRTHGHWHTADENQRALRNIRSTEERFPFFFV